MMWSRFYQPGNVALNSLRAAINQIAEAFLSARLTAPLMLPNYKPYWPTTLPNYSVVGAVLQWPLLLLLLLLLLTWLPLLWLLLLQWAAQQGLHRKWSECSPSSQTTGE
jgi:hypothetical protein